MFLSHTVVWSRDRDCTFACFQNRVVNSQRFPLISAVFIENAQRELRHSAARILEQMFLHTLPGGQDCQHDETSPFIVECVHFAREQSEGVGQEARN